MFLFNYSSQVKYLIITLLFTFFIFIFIYLIYWIDDDKLTLNLIDMLTCWMRLSLKKSSI